MNAGHKPDYRSCQHYKYGDRAEMILASGRLRHRLYGSCSPEIVTQNEEGRITAVVRLPQKRNADDWLVCLASYKEKNRNMRTWPEWTWGAARQDIPEWFRGADFKGSVRSNKSDWLISSCDVEDYLARLVGVQEIEVRQHHEELELGECVAWHPVTP